MSSSEDEVTSAGFALFQRHHLGLSEPPAPHLQSRDNSVQSQSYTGR